MKHYKQAVVPEITKLRIGEWVGILTLITVIALSLIGLDTLLREIWG